MHIEVEGVVVKGAGRGAGMGFPTANIALDPLINIRSGVYAVEVRFDGYRFGGVANVGTHPTVGESPVRLLEVHLFGFGGDLYGKTIHVRFITRLRDECRFDDTDRLREAVAEDIARAKIVCGCAL